jgi:hypothetical protein
MIGVLTIKASASTSFSRGPGGGSNDIATWVKAHGKAVSGVSTSGGTLYAVSA